MTNLEFIARVGRQHKIDTNKKWVVGLLFIGAGAFLLAYLFAKDSKRKGQTIKKQASELDQVKYANKEFATVNKIITEKSASQEQKINELERKAIISKAIERKTKTRA